MKVSTLTSILSMVAAVNIFYAVYTLTQDQLLNTLVFMVTFLVIMYTVAILDSEPEQYSPSVSQEI